MTERIVNENISGKPNYTHNVSDSNISVFGRTAVQSHMIPELVSEIGVEDLQVHDKDLLKEVEFIHGDALQVMATMPKASIDLVVTSPPYNIGKEYERKTSLEDYLAFMKSTLILCHEVLSTDGALCLQVGNFVDCGVIEPLDALLLPILKELGFKLRNRIVWTFGHGLHCSKRYSGRYETVLWLTKSNEFVFNLDEVRVPQKYPGKLHYKGPKKGLPSCNPLGKNPGDVWEIPNVKHNHPEKTSHPCQFPEALIERLVLAHSNPGQCVLDPFSGSGTVGVVCNRLGRRAILVEREAQYTEMACKRIFGNKQYAIAAAGLGR